jgi:arginine deiminase
MFLPYCQRPCFTPIVSHTYRPTKFILYLYKKHKEKIKSHIYEPTNNDYINARNTWQKRNCIPIVQQNTHYINTRNTNKEKMQLHTYKPTKLISYQHNTRNNQKRYKLVEEKHLHTTTKSIQNTTRPFYI